MFSDIVAQRFWLSDGEVRVKKKVNGVWGTAYYIFYYFARDLVAYDSQDEVVISINVAQQPRNPSVGRIDGVNEVVKFDVL